MDVLEMTGKTVEEAITAALAKLNATNDEVEIEILEVGAKGFLGIGSKPAKVLVKKKFDPTASARNFLREVFSAMNLKVDVDIKQKDAKELSINLTGDNMGVLIGKRGQTLDSLQYLTNLVVNKGTAPYMSIAIDTENYRQRRKETLESLAQNLAKKAKLSKKNVVLEPMSAYERRIIHATLQNNKGITTYSEGQEPYRYVVIAAKN